MKKSKPRKPSKADDSAQPPEQRKVLVVGIGASAGGIQALRAFFEQVPADSGAAYVVILHLSPDHDSQLASVLQSVSSIPVLQVTKRVKVEPNHVYVVPPDQHLEMVEGEIKVSPNLHVEERRAPVDIFFRTLAESHRERAVAVILSGSGANGSMGIKRVKEQGGAAFVQNPREAEFSEMPRNAIATQLIDEILPVAEIPAKIISYREALGTNEIPESPEQRTDEQQQALREIFTHLRVRTGHDFSNYKHGTVMRRISRRMTVHGLSGLPSYATYIKEHPEETQALVKDLLISVTNFFRDQKAFEALEQDVLPRILTSKMAEGQFRVWVAGCATGEEAYSLAMLLAERTLGVIDAPKIQIFATDIDEAAIAQAREGLYTLNDAADVSPERLRRFFTKEGEQYRVRRELREMILFAVHNVLKDPPFSRIDLVTCRNLLIYFNQTAQERVLETFHFALKPGGHLFLGTSESVGDGGDMFAPVNKDLRIYQSREVGPRQYPVPEATPFLRLEPPHRAVAETEQVERRPPKRISYNDLHFQLLELYAPPSVVVNEDYDIVHFSEQAGRYLQMAGGELSRNLLELIRPELRLELRTALYQAVQQQTNVEVKNLQVSLGDHTETINLHIRPVVGKSDTARGFILILFEPSVGASSATDTIAAQPEPVTRQLEQELIRTKAQLRSAIEQYETHAEELKAGNEELQAMNEELRSAAEELETLKEELQSINEELTAVNQELKVKIEETSLVSNNLQNLINSTNLATIFLDRSFRVNLFTPAARALFNLLPADLGRPLADITHRLEYDGLVRDAETVLDTLQGLDREVRTTDKHFYLMRLTPYRTAEDRIDGVVITFVDISERRRTEEALSESEEKYRTLFASMDEAYAVVEVLQDEKGAWSDFQFLEVNPAFVKQTGMEYPVGRKATELLGTPNPHWAQIYGQVAETGEPMRFEESEPVLGRTFDLYCFRLGSDGSRRVAVLFTDITERKRREANLAFLAEISEDLSMLYAPDDIIQTVGERLGKFLQASTCIFADVDEDKNEATIHHGWNTTDVPSLKQTFRLADYFGEEFRRAGRAGETVIVRDTSADERANAEAYAKLQLGAFVTVPFQRQGRLVANITVTSREPRDWRADEIELMEEVASRVFPRIERARAEAALRESEERLRLLIESAQDYAIFTLDLGGRIESWNKGAERLFGWSENEILGQPGAIIFTPEDREAGVPEEEIGTALERGSAPDERLHLRKDGTRFFVSGVLTLLRDGEGEPQGFAKIARDVTDRIETEEERERLLAELNRLNENLEQEVEERTREMLQSQERFRQAFEVGPLAAVMTTLEEDRFVEVNATFSKVTGYSKDEVIGKTAAQLKMWSDREDQEKLRAALQEDGTGYRELELKLKTKDGQARDILSSGEIIKLNGDKGWLKMFIDITERQQTEEQLMKAISAVMSDTAWFSQQVVQRLANVRAGEPDKKPVELTPRERQVLERMAVGKSDPEICKELDLTRQTVRNYVTNIYSKIGVHSRVEAVVWARERGIVG